MIAQWSDRYPNKKGQPLSGVVVLHREICMQCPSPVGSDLANDLQYPALGYLTCLAPACKITLVKDGRTCEGHSRVRHINCFPEALAAFSRPPGTLAHSLFRGYDAKAIRVVLEYYVHFSIAFSMCELLWILEHLPKVGPFLVGLLRSKGTCLKQSASNFLMAHE
jgi:hypothetical protein